MNGKQAKRIRKLIYRDEFSPRHREYKAINLIKHNSTYDQWVTCTFINAHDSLRYAYQQCKKEVRDARS